MDSAYQAAEALIKDKIGQYAATRHTAEGAPPTRLMVDEVAVSDTAQGSFVHRLSGAGGPEASRMKIAVQMHLNKQGETGPETDLRAAREEDVKAGVLAALKDALATVKLPDGATLDSKYDLSGKTPEETKPWNEQLADARKFVEDGVKQAGAALPPEVAALLTHAQTFDSADSGVIFLGNRKPSVEHGHVEMSYRVSHKDEGEKSNAVIVTDNIAARKDAILEAVREEAAATHQAAGAGAEEMEKFKAQLAALDLKVEADGQHVKLSLGSKGQPAADGKEATLAATELATFSEANLERIVNEAVLFKGQGAGDVAHLIADDRDVRRTLEHYKAVAPAFEEALKTEPMRDAMSFKERQAEQKQQETKPLTPEVRLHTGMKHGNRLNQVEIELDLPAGLNRSQLVLALAGTPLSAQSHTAKVDTGRAEAANNEHQAARSA